MDNERRKFLKIAGFSALAGIGAPAIVKLTSTASYASEQAAHGASEGKMAEGGSLQETGEKTKQYGMVIDMRKFMQNPELEDMAIEACINAHNIPQFPPEKKKDEIKWIWKTGFENAFQEHTNYHTSEEVEKSPFLILCNHCEFPPCVRVCPTKATFKMKETGIVTMDFHRCIGCRFCMAACPYGSRSFNWQDPRPYIKHLDPDFPTRMRGVVEKCSFCEERLAKGLEPACVAAVKDSGALIFGDINDEKSEIRQVLQKEFTIQRKPSAGTKPSVFYIV
ncbi:MAG: 4Fe-4S dicluster domain-containing protein [Geobacteraceae bacterium]